MKLSEMREKTVEELKQFVVDSKQQLIVVKVASYNPHPKYKKIIESNKNYKAHDANNECGIGDTVKIIESKPISGGKRWVLESIVEKAK